MAQYHIEQFLLDAASRKLDLIDIRWRTRVTAIDARSDGATLSLATPEAATGWRRTGSPPATAGAARSARRWACPLAGVQAPWPLAGESGAGRSRYI